MPRLHCLHGNIASLLLREGEKEGKRGGDFLSDTTSALFILCPRVLVGCVWMYWLMLVCLCMCFYVGLGSGAGDWLRLTGWMGWNPCNNCTQQCNASSNTGSIYKTAKWVQRPLGEPLSDTHFRVAFKLYYSEWKRKQTGTFLQNEPVTRRYRTHPDSGLAGRLALPTLCAGCMQASLQGEDWMRTPPPTTTTRNNKNHAACLLLFWLFFPPSSPGRGESGGGREKKGQGWG